MKSLLEFSRAKQGGLTLDNELESRFIFFSEGSSKGSSEVQHRVIAAERKMERSYKIGSFVRIHYALVLIDNGTVVEWTGSQSDYQSTIEATFEVVNRP